MKLAGIKEDNKMMHTSVQVRTKLFLRTVRQHRAADVIQLRPGLTRIDTSYVPGLGFGLRVKG